MGLDDIRAWVLQRLEEQLEADARAFVTWRDPAVAPGETLPHRFDHIWRVVRELEAEGLVEATLHDAVVTARLTPKRQQAASSQGVHNHGQVGEQYNAARDIHFHAPAPPPAARRVYNLPPPNPVFEGREALLRDVRDKLRAGGHLALVALSGMGGVGKTELAVQFAHNHLGDYPDGVFFVVAEGEPPGDALSRLLVEDALGVAEGDLSRDQRLAAAKARLGERQALLILDNVTHTERLPEALPSGGRCHVLVTTRQDLTPSKLVPTLSVEALAPDAALRVLAELARAQVGGHEAEARALAAFVEHLPLALQLLGAHMAEEVLGPVSLLDALRRREDVAHAAYALPDDGQPAVVSRGVAATFATAWEALELDAQRLLALAACWAPVPFPVEHLLGAAARLGLEEAGAKKALRHLRQRHLVVVGAPEGLDGDWLRLHRLLRGFVLGEVGEQAADRRAFVQELVRVAGEEVTVDRIPRGAALREHLERAHAWAPEALGEHEDITWPAIALGRLGEWTTDLDGAQRWYEATLQRAEQTWGAEHPMVAAGLNNLAALLQARGDLSGAEPLMRRSLALYEATYGPGHPKAAEGQNNLAVVLFRRGDLSGAESLLRRALVLTEAAHGPWHADVAAGLNNLAQLLHARGDLSGAEPLMRRALAIDEAAFGPGHPNVARNLNNLALLLYARGDLDAAEPLVRRALAIDEAAFGPGHPVVADDLNTLCSLLFARGDLDAAEPLFHGALAIDEATLGPEHPDIAVKLNNLAELLRTRGDLDAAEPLLRRALAINEAVYDVEHPNVAIGLNNLALVLQARGDLDAAEPLLRRALAIDEASYGPTHASVARDLNNLAALLQARGDLSGAEPLVRRALAMDEASYGPEHPAVATGLNNLAQLLQTRGDLSGAEPLLRRALAITEATLGPEHPDVALGLNNLAQLLHARGDLSGAEPLLRRALAITEATLGPDHPDVALGLIRLGHLLSARGALDVAEPLLRRALAIDEAAFGPTHPSVARDLNNLAALLHGRGNLDAAEPLMRRTVALDEALLGPEHPTVGIGLLNLAYVLMDLDDPAGAEPVLARALAIFRANLPPDHPYIADAASNLDALRAQLADTP